MPICATFGGAGGVARARRSGCAESGGRAYVGVGQTKVFTFAGALADRRRLNSPAGVGQSCGPCQQTLVVEIVADVTRLLSNSTVSNSCLLEAFLDTEGTNQ